ncbi:hypothetical protein HMPREF0650_0355 [Hoylesella buccalis ATCC 35310]|uniref:Uncharacterized protein n=1 Tax=Hoylesella buccalis ATCC 35310 TaxID=679190 RepID=D1W401_9BACT|nr:hypothetical protein HMPREF0650_0355 [Hoylesella buccalis ATCC 35310]
MKHPARPTGEKLTGSVGFCQGAMVSGFVFSMYASPTHCWRLH